MVVAQVLLEYPLEVSLIEDDHMVEALSSDRPDHPLDIWVLPRRPSCGSDLLDAHRRDSTSEIEAVDSISVPDEISRCSIPWKSFYYLLTGPRRSRVSRNIEVNDLPSRIIQDEEDVQHSEGCRGYGEEVD